MNFAKRKKKNSAINVTSLIDVMFLLLIFVLISAKFEPDKGISVNLPSGVSTEVPKVDYQVLSIKKDGSLYFDKTKIDYDNLSNRIHSMREKYKDPVVVINADEDTSYKYVAKAADIIKNSGQIKFNLKLK